MDSMTLIAVASIATAGLTTGIGCMCPALGEGRAVATALTSLAQQPDASATITPFVFPIVMTMLGLLTGMVQAYIFSILAAVYIAAATRTQKPKPAPVPAT